MTRTWYGRSLASWWRNAGAAWAAFCGLLLTPDALAAAAAPTVSRHFDTEQHDFVVGQHRAFLLLPMKPATNGVKPWIWYAPTFMVEQAGKLHTDPPDPSHTWMFRQWLAAGFAIGGVDVGESCGSPAGRAGFTEFYRHVVANYGLSTQACLLPQSRGGLMLYNWAAEHPEWVRCVGGIYTVCDLASYPGLAHASGAYGLTPAELGNQLAQHNPIERLAPLAKAGVPILHLHGDADPVVPLERNSGLLAERYRALGGPVELVVVHGKGHEVCPEFFQSQRLVDFFLAQAQPRRAVSQNKLEKVP